MTTDERWAAVDDFFEARLLGTRAAPCEAVLAASVAAGLPAIQVSPLQGQLLALLARAAGARRVLEVGTLGGYSAAWLCQGLAPGGRLVTLELEPTHAAVARASLAAVGLAERVEVRLGPARESLAALVAEAREPFDLVFIDADKEGYPDYLEWALRLSRPGTLIVADNVVRGGAVADAATSDARVLGVQRFCAALGRDARVQATAVQTVGAKGYDGFALAVVVEPGGA